MTARVLVVDDIFPNVKLLETKLSAEYFDVVTAMNGPDALALCEQGLCDIVLLDVMMPGMDGFEVCRRLKNAPLTAHLPVIMVTALDQPGDRLKGLDAGADDFLTKPLDDTALMARVRSLVRLKAVTDEMRTRAMTSRDFGIGDPLAAAVAETGLNAKLLLVTVQTSMELAITDPLTGLHNRRYLDSHLGVLFDDAAARGRQISVLLLDIDCFKAINDSYGHDAGDERCCASSRFGSGPT